jgi:ABC-type multidrug transport system fused ATPase/permease subunit
VTTIRAFDASERFAAENERILDDNQRVSFASLGTSNWLGFRLQCIGISVVSFVSFFSVIETQQGGSSVNPSLVGLAMAYALPLTDTLNGLIGSFTDTEKEIVSVERAVEYLSIRPEEQPPRDLTRKKSVTRTNNNNKSSGSGSSASSKSKKKGTNERQHHDNLNGLVSPLSRSSRSLTDPLLEPFQPDSVAG